MNIDKVGEIFRGNPKFAKRPHNESDHKYRDKFERDRDRILYSKEFRRLNRKTQVFVSGFDDHVRNRLTHTIEVAQISQTIANRLGLNEQLTEAIAYGHDVGHTPFGHVGERLLNNFMNGCLKIGDHYEVLETEKGFKHNWQSVRVVTELENISNKYSGLNLTDYTIWGMLNHTKIQPKKCDFQNDRICNFRNREEECICIDDKKFSFDFYTKYAKYFNSETSWTIEGLIVRMSDEIAQRHHDLEDGIYAKIIDRNEIINKLKSLFESHFTQIEIDKLDELKEINNQSILLHDLSSLIINFLVTKVIENTKINLEKIVSNYSLTNSESFNKEKSKIFNQEDVFNIVTFSDDLRINEGKFQKFLKNRVLNSHLAQSMDGKATYMLRKIIEAYMTNPQQLPDNTIGLFYKRYYFKTYEKYDTSIHSYSGKIGNLRNCLNDDHKNLSNIEYRTNLMRTITDFIAGMTDDFAIKQFNKLYSGENIFIANY